MIDIMSFIFIHFMLNGSGFEFGFEIFLIASGFDLDLDLSSPTEFGLDLDLQAGRICTPLVVIEVGL